MIDRSSNSLDKSLPRSFTCSLLAICLFLGMATAWSQDKEGAAGSLFSDPRFREGRKMLESEEVKDQAGALVDEATRSFGQLKNSETVREAVEQVATPENKAALRKAATVAVDDVLAGAQNQPDQPARLKPVAVPATRPPGPDPSAPPIVAKPISPEDTIRATEEAVDMVVQESAVETLAGAQPTAPRIPDSPVLAAADVPAPQKLQPKYDTRQTAGGVAPTTMTRGDYLEIKAQRTEYQKDLLVFFGDVVLDHPDGQIKCEKLEIHMGAGSGGDGAMAGAGTGDFKKAVASGGLVEIKRTVVEKVNGKDQTKTQLAIGRRAEYTAASGDFVLSGGPPYIQDGDKFIETTSPESKIVMYGNGKAEVTGGGGATARSRILVPIEGEDKTSGLGPSGGINFRR